MKVISTDLAKNAEESSNDGELLDPMYDDIE
jgi:hypothetical protein